MNYFSLLVVILSSIFFTFICNLAQAETEAYLPNVGGSNYVVYDLGRYRENPILDNWGDLKVVLGAYHLNPSVVSQQMQEMCDNGQRMIAFGLWFAPVGQPGEAKLEGHEMNSKGGVLAAQFKSNIKNVMTLATTLKTSSGMPCFQEIQFRFDQQHKADPGNWSGWDEAQYLENWNFIKEVVSITDPIFAANKTNYYYDLGGELAGAWEHNTRICGTQTPAVCGDCIKEYTKRLWKDYVDLFGKGHTYGFSFSYPYLCAEHRVKEMVAVYKTVGALPDQYAFDIYADLLKSLKQAKAELEAVGESTKPILVQETYYNDSKNVSEVQTAIAEEKIKVRALMQWPLARRGLYDATTHFTETYPKEASSYLAISPVGTLSATPNPCQIESGKSKCTSVITWNTNLSMAYLGDLSVPCVFLKETGQLMACGSRGTASAPWISAYGYTFELRTNNNYTQSTLLTSMKVQGQLPPPLITSAGTGCADNHCIWLVGWGFREDSYVDLRHPVSYELVWSLKGSELTRSFYQDGSGVMTLAVSDLGVQKLLDSLGLRVYVVNPTAGNWSEGFLVTSPKSQK